MYLLHQLYQPVQSIPPSNQNLMALPSTTGKICRHIVRYSTLLQGNYFTAHIKGSVFNGIHRILLASGVFTYTQNIPQEYVTIHGG